MVSCALQSAAPLLVVCLSRAPTCFRARVIFSSRCSWKFGWKKDYFDAAVFWHFVICGLWLIDILSSLTVDEEPLSCNPFCLAGLTLNLCNLVRWWCCNLSGGLKLFFFLQLWLGDWSSRCVTGLLLHLCCQYEFLQVLLPNYRGRQCSWRRQIWTWVCYTWGLFPIRWRFLLTFSTA